MSPYLVEYLADLFLLLGCRGREMLLLVEGIYPALDLLASQILYLGRGSISIGGYPDFLLLALVLERELAILFLRSITKLTSHLRGRYCGNSVVTDAFGSPKISTNHLSPLSRFPLGQPCYGSAPVGSGV